MRLRMAALGLLAILALAACPASPPVMLDAVKGPIPLAGGSPVPALTFLDLDGKTHTLADYQGQNVLLVMFAYWCPHCQDDMPQIQAFANQHPGLAFVPVEASGGDRTDVADFKTRFGVSAPIFYDPARRAATTLDVEYFPTVCLIGSNGGVLDRSVGLPPFEKYAQLLAGVQQP